jgi:hypothetical protein
METNTASTAMKKVYSILKDIKLSTAFFEVY